jgi:enterochelin esterase-like enzyme
VENLSVQQLIIEFVAAIPARRVLLRPAGRETTPTKKDDCQVADEQVIASPDPAPREFPERLRPMPAELALPLSPDDRPATFTSRLPLIVGLLLAVVVIAGAVSLSTLQWVGAHQSPEALRILRIQIIGGAVQVLVYVLAAASVVFLLARRPTRRRVVVGSIAVAGGAASGGAVLFILAETNALGVALSPVTSTWTVVGFAGIALGLASLWSRSGWRTIGSAFAVVFVLLAGTLGINADFGLDPSIGALAGISTLKTISVPVVKATPDPAPTVLDGGALWANWVPPADMQGAGTVSEVSIPGTISGFKARDAGIYYPPAALVKNPPLLPLVIMMMGQPGNPDPTFQAQILDQMEGHDKGLAPIVIVADQIGNPAVDPLCLNTSRFGNAETYITQDVVNWARSRLRILQDPAHWTIAGYSNGGECALAFGAKYPNLFGNVLDISGEDYPGSDESAAVLAGTFHGNTAAYQATWPVNILKSGKYPDTVAIFTVGSNDYAYRREAQTVDAAATAAGWKTTYFEVPNGGHVLKALNGGLAEGYAILYPRLGLSEPAPTAPPTP